MSAFPPSRILVPHDLSAASKAAWRHAETLADRFASALEVCHVWAYLPLEAAYIPPIPRRDLRRRLRAVVGQGPRVHLLEGDPAARILALATRRKADLIVMATHGRTGLARLRVGSVTEAVARGCRVPLLAVHRGPSRITRVLCPVNFTDYAKAGLRAAAEAAVALRASLTALNVLEPGSSLSEARSRASWILSTLPEPLQRACRPEVEFHRGKPVEGILRAARAHDLLALVSHRKSALRDAFQGTTAEQVLRLSPAPVLILPFK